MQRPFVISVTEAEAIRLYHILIDRDKEDALAFLEEHARKSLREFFEGGMKTTIDLSREQPKKVRSCSSTGRSGRLRQGGLEAKSD